VSSSVFQVPRTGNWLVGTIIVPTGMYPACISVATVYPSGSDSVTGPIVTGNLLVRVLVMSVRLSKLQGQIKTGHEQWYNPRAGVGTKLSRPLSYFRTL
jgi:hypothetical protein